ncbi:MAG: ROK family protein [Chloroflexi bacterium]|nr:ROK family protein [Chloroflexota bacterium]
MTSSVDEQILACDLGGTRLRVAVVDHRGSLDHKQVIATPADDPTVLVRMLREVADSVEGDIAGVVVGVPGPVDYSRGVPLKLPNLPLWEERVGSRSLAEALGMPVLLANDADLAALGEHRYGAGRGYQDMLYMTSSTGVGAGVVLNGRLLRGRLSIAEAGHTIIERTTGGTVEALGSGTALLRLSGENPASVAARAAAGDSEALHYFNDVAEAFAVGVFNLVHCFSPEVVVIGGGMSRSGDLLLNPIRRMLAECGGVCPSSRAVVVEAQGGDDVGLRGAAAFWAEGHES